jgi:hypothetical protein
VWDNAEHTSVHAKAVAEEEKEKRKTCLKK